MIAWLAKYMNWVVRLIEHFDEARQSHRNKSVAWRSRVHKYGLVLPQELAGRMPLISAYLAQALPAPSTFVAVPKVGLWGMMGNADLGDCVFAFCGHAQKAVAAWIGKAYSLKDATVIAAYKAYCKTYSNGQDQGANPLVVLKNWMTTRMFGGTLGAMGRVNFRNATEVMQFVEYTGAVGVSVNLPKSAETQFNRGVVWDVDQTLDNAIAGGHQMCVVGYKPGLNNLGGETTLWAVVTWAVVVWITQEWMDAYAQQMQALITPELMTQKVFDGFKIAQLQVDVTAAIA